MSDTPIAIEINCETNEVIERPLTQEEIDAAAVRAAEHAARQAEEAAAAQAKAEAKASAEAKLAALGLTPEEIAAL